MLSLAIWTLLFATILLLLGALQAGLDDGGGAGRTLRIGAALVVGGFLWVLALSLLTLALSAVFKRRILAQVGLVVCFFVASGFGNAINGTMHTTYGTMLSLSETTQSVWVALFGVPPPDGNRLMPPAAAWVGVLGVISLCLWVLSRKVRAHEVVS